MGSIGGQESAFSGTPTRAEALEWPTYWVDTMPWGWISDGVYTRQKDEILGEELEEPDDASRRQSRCFNCGSQEHMLSDCTEKRNQILIALSRSMYQFFSATAGLGSWKRVHDVEEWRQQRLHWLEDFEPGQIRGALLQDALGGQDGDWLKNMAVWGYPAGWVSHEDPRKQVKHRIWNEDLNGAVDDLVDINEPFLIHGDGDHFEEVSFSSSERFQLTSDDEESDVTSGSELDDSTADPPKRWAQFTDSQFSSTLLPVYNGIALPMLPGQDAHSFSSTFSTDRQGLWHRIIAGQNLYPPLPEDFPWLPPPPPEDPPPPIPPPPPPDDPPPLPPLLCSNPLVSNNPPAVSNLIDTEVDMDMSD